MRSITIDCTPALHTTNGVGRVTATLLEAMVPLKGDLDFTLFSRSFSKRLPTYKDCKKAHMKLPECCESWIDRLKLIERISPKETIFHATNHYMPVKKTENTIVTVHDLIFLKSPEQHLQKIHAEMARKAPQFIKDCKHIITCSEYTKKDLHEFISIPEEKITVIQWGLNNKHFVPPSDIDKTKAKLKEELNIDKPYFLGVSCSEGRKNTPMLIECYQKLLESNPKNDLVLVWSPPDHIREKFKHPRIHFTGKVSDDLLRDLYGCATATFYPSHYEGFGLPVLESMSCGTPIVCSNVTSLPDVGGDVALYITPTEPDTISEQFEKFENDHYDLEELSKRGIDYSATFTWKNCAKKTLDVYRKCS
ncbi:MAG: glycosyltransferase family 4 protein [Lentisphaerales bacterium]|nr:glycosyltransferase family 4 protein [Lentisphaerales bacterium]